jgi:hypothetical protein
MNTLGRFIGTDWILSYPLGHLEDKLVFSKTPYGLEVESQFKISGDISLLNLNIFFLYWCVGVKTT